MNRLRAALLVGALLPAPAPAIDFGLGLFKKKDKGSEAAPAKPAGPVATLRADPDEGRRKTAAEFARSLDPRANPDLIPALVQALQNDPSPAVRGASADSIGRLKPVQPLAGAALESAQLNDPSPLVREASRNALWQYHLNGYRTPPAAESAAPTPEPPLALKAPEPPAAAPKPSKAPVPAQLTSQPKGPAPLMSSTPPVNIPRPMPAVTPNPTPAIPVPVVPPAPAVPAFAVPATPSAPPPGPATISLPTLPSLPTVPVPVPPS